MLYCNICSAKNAMPFGPEEEICKDCLIKLQKERIEELEQMYADIKAALDERSAAVFRSRYITDEQIDALWKYLHEIGDKGVATGYEQALYDLGIERCEGCEGDGHYDGSFDPERGLGTCRNCNGKGWSRHE